MLAPGMHAPAGARIGFIVANPLIKEIGGCRPAHGLVGVDEDEEPVLKLFLQMSSPIWAGTLNPWWSTSNVAHPRCGPQCRAAVVLSTSRLFGACERFLCVLPSIHA